MIDIIKAKKYFKEYASKFEINEPRIKLKMIHMHKVAEISRVIAESLGLSKEEQDLAELIGLLHDIGRFEQWKCYNTYSDKLSIDHGQKGVEVLFGDKIIRNFIEDDKYDSIIYKAIDNHNKFQIETGLSGKELLFTKIVRDADNIDIYRGCVETPLEDHTHYGSKDVSKEILSTEFAEKFCEEKTLLYGNAKSDMDVMVAIIAHIYAINFAESLKIIKENDYIQKFIRKINAKDEYTHQKLDEIADYAMEYINKKLNNK